jgi:hypothetical protein
LSARVTVLGPGFRMGGIAVVCAADEAQMGIVGGQHLRHLRWSDLRVRAETQRQEQHERETDAATKHE